MSRLYTCTKLMPISADYFLIFKLGKDRKLTLLKHAIFTKINEFELMVLSKRKRKKSASVL